MAHPFYFSSHRITQQDHPPHHCRTTSSSSSGDIVIIVGRHRIVIIVGRHRRTSSSSSSGDIVIGRHRHRRWTTSSSSSEDIVIVIGRHRHHTTRSSSHRHRHRATSSSSYPLASVVANVVERSSWEKSRRGRKCRFPPKGGLHHTSGDASLETPLIIPNRHHHRLGRHRHRTTSSLSSCDIVDSKIIKKGGLQSIYS